jgi:hypothetical protein
VHVGAVRLGCIYETMRIYVRAHPSSSGIASPAARAIRTVFCAWYARQPTLAMHTPTLPTCLSIGASIISRPPRPSSSPTAPAADACACAMARTMRAARAISAGAGANAAWMGATCAGWIAYDRQKREGV